MSRSDSDSLSPRRRTPEWVPGIFYPLVVAALLGVAAILSGLREDVAVLKVRIETLERATGIASRGTESKRASGEPIPASAYTATP